MGELGVFTAPTPPGSYCAVQQKDLFTPGEEALRRFDALLTFFKVSPRHSRLSEAFCVRARVCACVSARAQNGELV